MPDFIRGVYGLPDSGLQNSPVDIPVKILEHVENHPAYGGAFVRVKVFLNGIHRNFRSPFVGEMEPPVEMQQNAMLLRPFSPAHSRHDL